MDDMAELDELEAGSSVKLADMLDDELEGSGDVLDKLVDESDDKLDDELGGDEVDDNGKMLGVFTGLPRNSPMDMEMILSNSQIRACS